MHFENVKTTENSVVSVHSWVSSPVWGRNMDYYGSLPSKSMAVKQGYCVWVWTSLEGLIFQRSSSTGTCKD